MALVNKRLEMMRQLTKGPSLQIGSVYVLIEVETNQVLGTYQDETLAEVDQAYVFRLYGIETDIKLFPIDKLQLD